MKNPLPLLSIIILTLLLTGSTFAQTSNPLPASQTPVMGGVDTNGWLQVNGTQLCNESGTPTLLRGMSSHGIHWYPQFASKDSIQNTADHGANVFRIAMYTGQGGYMSNKNIKTDVINTIDTALSLNMYVIVDWHMLYDTDFHSQTDASKEFFQEISLRYKDAPGVIYEICNEPNGGSTWANDIYPYAMEIIPVIRVNSPNAIIICGTSTWSQDVDIAASQPLPYDNVMYSLHFYAGTHGDELRAKTDRALSLGLPIFVTEWGTCSADGNNGPFLNESQVWLDYLNARGISWVNWSLCDKNESSAALRPGTLPDTTWQPTDLSASGTFVFSQFRQQTCSN